MVHQRRAETRRLNGNIPATARPPAISPTRLRNWSAVDKARASTITPHATSMCVNLGSDGPLMLRPTAYRSSCSSRKIWSRIPAPRRSARSSSKNENQSAPVRGKPYEIVRTHRSESLQRANTSTCGLSRELDHLHQEWIPDAHRRELRRLTDALNKSSSREVCAVRIVQQPEQQDGRDTGTNDTRHIGSNTHQRKSLIAAPREIRHSNQQHREARDRLLMRRHTERSQHSRQKQTSAITSPLRRQKHIERGQNPACGEPSTPERRMNQNPVPAGRQTVQKDGRSCQKGRSPQAPGDPVDKQQRSNPAGADS